MKTKWAKHRFFCLTDRDAKLPDEPLTGDARAVLEHLEQIAQSIGVEQAQVGHILARRAIENYLPIKEFKLSRGLDDETRGGLEKLWVGTQADQPVPNSGRKSTNHRYYLSALALEDDCDVRVLAHLDFCKGNKLSKDGVSRTHTDVWVLLSKKQQSVLGDGFEKKHIHDFFMNARSLEEPPEEIAKVLKTIRERM